MILDERTEFLDNVALNTGAPGNFLLGDVIDLTNVRDIGQGEPLYLVANVDVTATSGGSATLQLTLLTDDNGSLSSPVALVSSAVIPVASLVAGANICAIALPLDAAGAPYERFIGIRQVTGTAAFTAGAISAYLTHDVSRVKHYADAVN
jgi:hypothetical protein